MLRSLDFILCIMDVFECFQQEWHDLIYASERWGRNAKEGAEKQSWELGIMYQWQGLWLTGHRGKKVVKEHTQATSQDWTVCHLRRGGQLQEERSEWFCFGHITSQMPIRHSYVKSQLDIRVGSPGKRSGAGNNNLRILQHINVIWSHETRSDQGGREYG